MLTDTKSGSMRLPLQQIYVNIYVEFVVKNPLSPAEHPGGIGVNNELFEASLTQFVVCTPALLVLWVLTRPGSCLEQSHMNLPDNKRVIILVVLLSQTTCHNFSELRVAEAKCSDMSSLKADTNRPDGAMKAVIAVMTMLQRKDLAKRLCFMYEPHQRIPPRSRADTPYEQSIRC